MKNNAKSIEKVIKKYKNFDSILFIAKNITCSNCFKKNTTTIQKDENNLVYLKCHNCESIY